MLKIDNIAVKYGNMEAVHSISLEVKEGEMVALLGANGAGKSTTINTISGLTDMTAGSISFCGEDITHLPIYERVRKGIVQVPEGRKLFPYLSVFENLQVGSYLPEVRTKRKEQLEMCFEIFPKLFERKKQLAGSLSGGEQQMVAIARGLMQCPKILMLDEPSLGLAPIIVDEIFEVLVNINKKQGMTVLLVEQNVLASLGIVDRAYVIETGRNVIDAEAKKLLDDPAVKEAYLGI